MSVQQLKRFPRGPLSQLIQCLWYWEGAPQGHTYERLLPNGEPSVIFNLLEDPIRIYDADDLSCCNSFGSAVFSGARSDCFAIDTCQQERVIGIQFQPGGAFPFLRMPAAETEGLSVDLEELWPRQTGVIRERVLEAATPHHALLRLEQCLLQQLVRPPCLHPAITYALRRFETTKHVGRVMEVVDSTGFSSRRFIELFREQVGLRPKTFCRVRRFQHALVTAHRGDSLDWAQVALASGYYDQAHFIHDFRSFSGLTPNEYMRAATPHLNHVPLR